MKIFKKYNSNPENDALIKEAYGLNTLSKVLKDSHNLYLKIPQVVSVSHDLLTIIAIEQQPANPTQMQQLGIGLALLHSIPQIHYGFSEDNYIGLNPQENAVMDSWGQFFIHYRLQ